MIEFLRGEAWRKEAYRVKDFIFGRGGGGLVEIVEASGVTSLKATGICSQRPSMLIDSRQLTDKHDQ